MRAPLTRDQAQEVLAALGRALRHEARVYITGGASAVLCGWRESTIDLDLKVVPDGEAFRAIAMLKESLHANIELASPLDFLPPLPGWEERSVFLRREGKVSFFHFDFYSQALAKVERGFEQDMDDVRAMVRTGLVDPARALELFESIEPQLERFPAVDPGALRRAVGDAFGGGAAEPGQPKTKEQDQE